jgi:hypothetical protein
MSNSASNPQSQISLSLAKAVRSSIWLDTKQLSDLGVDVSKLCDRDGYDERAQNAKANLIVAAETLDKQTKVIQDLLAVLHPGAVGLIANEHGSAALVQASAAVMQAKALLTTL